MEIGIWEESYDRTIYTYIVEQEYKPRFCKGLFTSGKDDRAVEATKATKMKIHNIML